MIKKLIVVLIGIFIFISCTDDTGLSAESDKNNVEEAVPVKLVVTVPASVTYVRTRGANNYESLISEIQVLVFEEGKYVYRVPGLSISGTSPVTTFTVLLKSGNVPMKLLILANATDVLVTHEPVIGDCEEVVKKKLNRRFDNLTSHFPMYGEYELPRGFDH